MSKMLSFIESSRQRKAGNKPHMAVYNQRASPPEGTLPTNPMLSTICRLCMVKGSNMKDIFKDDNAFAKKLYEVVQLEIEAADGFPTLICHRCSLQLNSAYTFKMRCLDSHKKLADIIHPTLCLNKQEVKEELHHEVASCNESVPAHRFRTPTNRIYNTNVHKKTFALPSTSVVAADNVARLGSLQIPSFVADGFVSLGFNKVRHQPSEHNVHSTKPQNISGHHTKLNPPYFSKSNDSSMITNFQNPSSNTTTNVCDPKNSKQLQLNCDPIQTLSGTVASCSSTGKDEVDPSLRTGNCGSVVVRQIEIQRPRELGVTLTSDANCSPSVSFVTKVVNSTKTHIKLEPSSPHKSNNLLDELSQSSPCISLPFQNPKENAKCHEASSALPISNLVATSDIYIEAIKEEVEANITSVPIEMPSPSKNYPFSFVGVEQELPEIHAEEVDSVFPTTCGIFSGNHKVVDQLYDHDYCTTYKLERDVDVTYDTGSEVLLTEHLDPLTTANQPTDGLQIEENRQFIVPRPQKQRPPRKSDLTKFKTNDDMTDVTYFMNCKSVKKLLKISQPKKNRKTVPKVVAGMKGVKLRKSSAKTHPSITESIEATVNDVKELSKDVDSLPNKIGEAVGTSKSTDRDLAPVETLNYCESTGDYAKEISHETRPSSLMDIASTSMFAPENVCKEPQTGDDIELDFSLFSSQDFLAMEDDTERKLQIHKPRKKIKMANAKESKNSKNEGKAKHIKRQHKKRSSNEQKKQVNKVHSSVEKKLNDKTGTKLETPKELKTYTCKHCETTFEKLLYLDTHLKHHCGPNKKDFTCNLCAATFLLGYKLHAHLKTSHPGEHNYTCNICNRSFKRQQYLMAHNNRYHTKERVFLCSVCGKTFSRGWELSNHMRYHSDDRPYSCQFCQKTFVVKHLLWSHLRLHSDKMEFNCGHCNRNFKHKATLRGHIYSHIGKRPFKCMLCRKRFCIKSDLTKHLRVHTGEHPYECSVCGKAFTQRWYLRKHPCIGKDQLDSQSSIEESLELQLARECKLEAQPTEEENLEPQPAREESLESQPATEYRLVAQPTEEENLEPQPAREESLESQSAKEWRLEAQPTKEENREPQPARECKLDVNPANEVMLLKSQPAKDNSNESQPSKINF